MSAATEKELASPAAENKPPKFETPAVADAGGPVPRVIKPVERAPRGFARYKIRCLNYAPPVRPTKYILAGEGEKGEAEARKHYLEVTGILKEAQRQAKNRTGKDSPQPEDPDLHVTVLPD